MCTSISYKLFKVMRVGKKILHLTRCQIILHKGSTWLMQKKVLPYNTMCCSGKEKTKKPTLFLSSTTNLGFVAFKLCYGKGPHSQEDFQRLIHLFIKKKKDTKHSYNCHFLNRTAPNHISIPSDTVFPILY